MGDNEKNVSANTPNVEPRQEHVSIIPVSQEVVIDKCVADNCCDGKVHCPFCDTDHFKPTQPTRVRDHLELLHMSYAVQAEDLIIVKCFSNCGLSAGHYHCPYCPSKLRKRYAFTLHLYTHMQKLGKDKKCIVVPDPKNPTTIKGLGPEIHLCKKEECYVGLNATESNVKSKTNQTTQCPSTQNPNNLASTSTTSATENNADTGPHYHCPLCNLICKRRSPLINHLWRCMERSRTSQPVVDEKHQRAINPDLDEANKLPHPCDVKEIKYHLSIVRTLSDLPIAKCSSPDCDCGNKYHCPLCVEERFKPNYLCHLRLHYFAHWKRRVSYKDYSVLLCNNRCEVLAGRHRVRYHFHCPICGSTRRRRQGFIHHLEICKGHPRNKSKKTKDGINEDSALTSSLVEEEEKEEEAEEEEEEEEEEGEGVEEEELLGLDDQFTSDLMMVRDEEAEEEELEKEEREEAGKSKEVEMLVKIENVNIIQMEAGNEESTTKMNHCKEIQYQERTKEKKDDKMSNEEMNDIIELHPQTETASQFTKEELYDQVSARLSFKCVDAFREKGNVDEIFSSIALRTGAEWSFAPATIDTMSVHEFVGDLQALASTRDLLFKALVGEVSSEQVKNGLVEKQINSGPMISNTKTQVMDASVQVEDSNFPTFMLQPSMRKSTQPFKPSILNKKSVKKTFSIADMNPKFMNPVQRKRGRPRKVAVPLEVVDSTNLENGSVKEQNVITVQQAPKQANVFTAMNLGTSCETSHSPRKRGRPRKIFIDKPVAMEILADSPIDKANEVSIIDVPNKVNIIDTSTEVSTIISEANQSSIKEISGQGPEKRKRGRPRKDKTLQIVSQTVVLGEERQSIDDIPLTPTSDPVSPEGCSTPKRYSTRGKKIDLSFLTGKNKKEDEKFVIEEGLFCLKKTKLDPSSSHLLSVKRDLFEKDDNSGHSDSTRDNGFGISLSEAGAGVVASKSQFKKKSKAQQPLIMSDVALLPTIRVDIVQKRRRNKKMTNIKNKKTLAKKSNVSYSSHSSERSGENSSSMNDGAALIEGSDAKLTSDDEGLRCHLCKLKGERFDEISDHLILVHGLDKPLRCDVCERTFEKRFDLQSHINRKHGPFPRMDSLVCFKCGKIFQGSAKLKWHLSFIHKITPEPPPKKKTWPCKQCNYSKKCNLCGKVFSKSNHLVTHVQAVHTKEKAAECTICNKKFNHIRYLRTHMKRHQGIKKHQCPTCGWRFFESNTLKDHMETHKEASKRHYRFTCEYCGQKYISKANFSDHLNKHTGEKPHKCQMCGKGFAFRTMLIKHQIHIHTTEKPFKCSYCERAFKFKAKLLQHNVIHTGVSKYVCQCCNKPFSCAATLKHHQPRCRGNNSSWPQNKTVTNESVTLMVDDLTLEQQQQTEQPPPQQAEVPETVEIPVEDQGDIVIDMSGLSGMPEGSILQAAAQAAQLMEIPEVFMCSECNAVFSSLADAEEHVTSLHTDVAVASTGVVEGSATELKTVEEPAASTEYVDATTTAESGST